jgi:hypothetical protein
MTNAAIKRPTAKPALNAGKAPSLGGSASRERSAAQEQGPGFAFLLAPHPGRIRAMSLGQGGTLGRSEEADLLLDAPGVAPLHARVELIPRLPGGPMEIYITDSGTNSGIYVSGMRASRTVLSDGDLLRIGGAIALVVDKDIGSYDGAVVDEAGIVRGPRSKRGWLAALDAIATAGREGKRVVVVAGKPGSGRRSAIRRIAAAWGVAPLAEEGEAARSLDIDVDAIGSDDALEKSLTAAFAKGGAVLRGIGALEAAQQGNVLRAALARRGKGALFVVVDELSGDGVAIEALVRDGGHRVEVPSIETRREEIPTLVRARFEKRGVGGNRLSIELYEAFARAAWPGEIEELVEFVDRIAEAHADVPRLGPEHLVRPLSRRGGRQLAEAKPEGAGGDAEKIRAALVQHKGSVAAAARALHLSRQALYREAARLGIDIRRARDEGVE